MVLSALNSILLILRKRNTSNIQYEHGLGYRIVHDMTRDLVGLNHCVYFDRFFTRVNLIEKPLRDSIHACGMVMTNRKNTPPALKVNKRTLRRNLPNRGDNVCYQKARVAVTTWNDNNVIVIAPTNLPKPDKMVTCECQIGREKHTIPQPKAIKCYNHNMNGVDVHDQMTKSTQLVLVRSTGSTSWFVIDWCRVNAWIIYKEASTRQVGRVRFTNKNFILEHCKELIGDFLSRKHVTL